MQKLLTVVSLLFALGISVAPTRASINFVQEAHGSSGATYVSTFSVTYSNPVTRGNALVAWLAVGNPSTCGTSTVTVADNVNGSWMSAGNPQHDSSLCSQVQWFYFVNASGGTPQVTATISASGPVAMNILEYSGISTSIYDAVVGTNYSGGTTDTTPTVTTSSANDLVLGAIGFMCCGGPDNFGTVTVSSPYAFRSNSGQSFVAEYVAPTAGSTSGAQFTSQFGDAVEAMTVAFKAASGGNPVAGCGNSLLYDETDCGAAAVPHYTAISPTINSTNGTLISACGATINSNTNYYLNANLGTDAGATCITIPGVNNINIDLGGFTVTGQIQLNTAGGLNSGIAVYDGAITCSFGNKDGCLNVNNNTAGNVSNAILMHHLTLSNTLDTGTNNTTSTGNPFVVTGDLGKNTYTGTGSYEAVFEYLTINLTNNNYASGRTGAMQITVGNSPIRANNNSVTIGGGEAASQGIVFYGSSPGSSIDHNIVNIALSLYNSPATSYTGRAYMYDFSTGTAANPLVIAFNDAVTNDSRGIRIRDSVYPYVHDNYIRGIRGGGAEPGGNSLGAYHLGDANTFPISSVTGITCGSNAMATNGCTLTLNGNQAGTFHVSDWVTFTSGTPSTLQETVQISAIASNELSFTYPSHNSANNNVSSSASTVAFVYASLMNGTFANETVQEDCSVDKSGILIGERSAVGNVFKNFTVTTSGDCTTSFTGSLFTRYLNAAKDSFLLQNTTFSNQLGGSGAVLLKTVNGPSTANQDFGVYCNTLGTNGTTDGDPGWQLQASCP